MNLTSKRCLCRSVCEVFVCVCVCVCVSVSVCVCSVCVGRGGVLACMYACVCSMIVSLS